MDDKKIMKIIAKDGHEKEYEIICTFKLPSTGKNYIVYTDDANKSDIYVAIYDPYDDTKLEEITDNYEWNTVKSVIDSIINGGDKQ